MRALQTLQNQVRRAETMLAMHRAKDNLSVPGKGGCPTPTMPTPATIQPISFFWQVPLQTVNGFVQCAPSIERPMAYDAAHSDSGMVSSTRTRDSIFKRTR